MYIIAKDGLTLEKVVKKLKTKRVKATSGSDSAAKGIIGAPGQDKNISVPCGVMIYNQNEVLLGNRNFFQPSHSSSMRSYLFSRFFFH